MVNPNNGTHDNSPPTPQDQRIVVSDDESDAPSPGADLSPLIRQFESLVKSIRRQATYVDSKRFGLITLSLAETRLERLNQLWLRLNAIQEELIGHVDVDSVEECQAQFDDGEDLYFIASGALRGKIKELAPLQSTYPNEDEGAVGGAPERLITVSVNLPDWHEVKNTWGMFDGSLLKWQSFHDCFIARVHNDDKIPNAYKFTLLRDSLTGHAAQTLGEWHLTEDSYAEAWDRLLQVYNKQYPIIREHLRQFERLPQIMGPASSDELQRLSNVTHETLRQLKAMKLPVDS